MKPCLDHGVGPFEYEGGNTSVDDGRLANMSQLAVAQEIRRFDQAQQKYADQINYCEKEKSKLLEHMKKLEKSNLRKQFDAVFQNDRTNL